MSKTDLTTTICIGSTSGTWSSVRRPAANERTAKTETIVYILQDSRA